MIKKTLFKVKIIQCHCPIMWYKNSIGMILECERVKNEGRLFAPFTESFYSFRALEDIEIVIKSYLKEVESPNNRNKYIETIEPVLIFKKMTGWMLDEDVAILDCWETPFVDI